MSQPAANRHVSVMRSAIVEFLAPALTRPDAVCVDATLGMGGHAQALLEAAPQARMIGIDRDQQALDLASERLAGFGDRFQGVHARYDEIGAIIDAEAPGGAAAILFDLGVSSLQIDEVDRGFAYRVDAPLDMRMDQSGGETAADLVSRATAEELTYVLRTYGEERYAARVARAIVQARSHAPVVTTGQLSAIVAGAIPAAAGRTGGHPAKRTFQALRIAVNDELEIWERAVTAAIAGLALGGRMAVLSYHSLEDRITKQAFAAGATSRAPRGLPVELPEHAPYLRLLTRGAATPSREEIAENPRAASARLRVVERIGPTLEVA